MKTTMYAITIITLLAFSTLSILETVGQEYTIETEFMTVVHDVATGKETLIKDDPLQQPVELNSLPPYEGTLPTNTAPENVSDPNDPKRRYAPQTVFDPDDRTRIYNTESYPWRTICKLFITRDDDTTTEGTGVIIGSPDGKGNHVLTAGHCVYSHDHGGWVKTIEVVPGYNNGTKPFGSAKATRMRSYTGWTQNKNKDHDWALVTLDKDFGPYTGWMGIKTDDPSSSIYTGRLNTAGYPGDLDDGEYMYRDSDDGRTATEYRHYYWMDTAGGQSGSPVWIYYSSTKERWIISIHTTSGTNSSGNYGTRIDQEKYWHIIHWCYKDMTESYPDVVDDSQKNSGFTPTELIPGDNFRVWCRIRNIGTSSAYEFYVSYYASTDSVIDTSDYLLGTDYISQINPFGTATSDWQDPFPDTIPPGFYFVGWIIDSGNHVTEFNEANNISYETSYKLKVNSYVDLVDKGQAYSGFIPTELGSGENFFVWCNVQNTGTDYSGSFYVSYYVSTNSIITTSDYFIGTDDVPSISPGSFEYSGWEGPFPDTIPPAFFYYVGWIIDSGNHVSESDERNNVAYASQGLWVKAPSYFDEYFFSVTIDKLDTDDNDYDDAVRVEMDVDTTYLGTLTVKVDAYLINSIGNSIAINSSSWSITGTEVEYGYVILRIPSGSEVGWYDVKLTLIDQWYNLEDVKHFEDVIYYQLPDPSSYDEYFSSVYTGNFDSDGDGYGDAVRVEMNVDTSYSGTLTINVFAYLNNPSGNLVASNSSSWSITGTTVEYGYVILRIPSGSEVGWYDLKLTLIDQWNNHEEDMDLEDVINYSARSTSPYDLNSDGVINIIDVSIVARAYGADSPEHPRYDPTADLNGDGQVNIIDISMVALHYGETT